MSNAPRIEIDLEKISHNTRTLVETLRPRNISVTGITKATLGSPLVANAMLQAGATAIGDSRIDNLETMRRAGITSTMVLVRSPMLSEALRVVGAADISFNTEISVIRQLSCEAMRTQRSHGIVLMVELGDLREGVLPEDLIDLVGEVLTLPNITLKGIGTNLACRYGVSPDDANMGELTAITDAIESTFALNFDTVSGGNSATLLWLEHCLSAGRINNVRLGEAILLGCEPLHRNPIDGLYTDAFALIAEVIEYKAKPSLAKGKRGQSAFGEYAEIQDHGTVFQAILALGIQDTDPKGLTAPPGVTICAASSDHLIIETTSDYDCHVGSEIRFQLNYSSLLRCMTSPFVNKIYMPVTE